MEDSHFYFDTPDITKIPFDRYPQVKDTKVGEDIELECSKVCLLDSFDIVYQQPNGGVLCSERLKQAIEENGITGFEFFEIDYEVVAE